VLLATKLTAEQCNERLRNAIDPIPPLHERVRSGNKTTWSTNPLPGAGRRTTGFGYAPGTRPVVGTIIDGHFRLEKRLVSASFGNTAGAAPVVAACCSGHVLPLEHGAQIEVDMERPGSSQAYLVLIGLFAGIVALPGIMLLLSYLSGSDAPAPVTSRDVFGCCTLMMIVLFPLVLLAVGAQSGQTDREYLLKFLKQVCEASAFDNVTPHDGRGYTGKTQRLS
jgi:hypothetical protein